MVSGTADTAQQYRSGAEASPLPDLPRARPLSGRARRPGKPGWSNVKKFVKDHGVQIAVGAAIVVGVACATASGGLCLGLAVEAVGALGPEALMASAGVGTAGQFLARAGLAPEEIEAGVGAEATCSLAAKQAGPEFNEDQRALVELAKEAKQRGGVSLADGNTLADWADEFGLPGHGPAIHPGRGGWSGSNVHVNIGPIKHIPVIP